MTHPRTAGFDAVRPIIRDAIGIATMTPGLARVLDTFADAAGLPRVEAAPAPASPPPPSGPLSPSQRMIDAKLLKIACPENNEAELALWVEPTRAACQRWGIDTMREVASFLANIGVESAGLTRLDENLNYSAKRLAEVWPNRYAVNPNAPMKDRQPNALARSLAHDPEALANNVYANRMGNGPPASGDGWRFRGYGPKQLTGRNNQSAYARAVGIDVEQVPSRLRTREGGMDSAGWFWLENGLDRLAATPGVEDDRRAINGGLIGVDEVRRRFNALIDEMLRREGAGR
jgi:putative chitinase